MAEDAMAMRFQFANSDKGRPSMDAGSRLESYLREGRTVVTELYAKELLRDWGLPVPPCHEAVSLKDALASADRIGYPVVLKAHSPAILHRSDVGGVRLNLNGAGEVAQAYQELRSACLPLDPKVTFLVQPMVPPGIEVIVGVTEDPQFGSVVMFGLGGVTAELFKDVVFRVPPLDHPTAVATISSIQAFPLLAGYRGQPAADINALADILVSVSALITKYPCIRAMDLNPVIVHTRGAEIVDARMVLRPDSPN